MDLNWIQSGIYGFISGLMDIIPISAHAHKMLFLKFFGVKESASTLELLIHIAVFAALYYSTQAQLTRIRRARALSRIPKKKRKRPLDTRSLMDSSLLMTMMIPVILGLILYRYTAPIRFNLVYISLFLFLNGIILYMPQFFPTGNRDARTLSRIEGVLMGLGGALSVLPGVSAVGSATTVASICGVEKKYALNMTLILNMVVIAGLMVYDILGIIESGLGALSFMILLQSLFSAAMAFLGTMLGIRIMRYLADNVGYSIWGVYCWGMALFIFILNLMA